MSGLFDISYFQKQIVRLTRHFSPRRKPSRAYSVFIEDARRRIRPVQLRNVRTHQRPLCLRLCFSWRRAKRTSASAFLAGGASMETVVFLLLRSLKRAKASRFICLRTFRWRRLGFLGGEGTSYARRRSQENRLCPHHAQKRLERSSPLPRGRMKQRRPQPRTYAMRHRTSRENTDGPRRDSKRAAYFLIGRLRAEHDAGSEKPSVFDALNDPHPMAVVKDGQGARHVIFRMAILLYVEPCGEGDNQEAGYEKARDGRGFRASTTRRDRVFISDSASIALASSPRASSFKRPASATTESTIDGPGSVAFDHSQNLQ